MAYVNQYSASGAPSWWLGKTTADRTPQAQYNMIANALIPFMSPEDRAAVANNLYRSNQADFAEYGNIATPKASYQVTTPERDYYTSADRARQATETLNRLRTSTGATVTDLGPGFAYLQRVVDLLNKYGGDPNEGTAPPIPGRRTELVRDPVTGALTTVNIDPNPYPAGNYVAPGPRRQTRQEYVQMMGELDPLLAEGKSEALAPYEPLVQKMIQPFFSGGKITPVSKDATGNWVFGERRKEWY